MKKKFAALSSFEKAEELKEELKNCNNEEEKKGIIMTASQLYFYAGEFGLKYLLDLDTYLSREDVFYHLQKNGIELLGKLETQKLIKLYTLLLPKKSGGQGLRNLGAYEGENGRIFRTHIDFAKEIIKLVKKNE